MTRTDPTLTRRGRLVRLTALLASGALGAATAAHAQTPAPAEKPYTPPANLGDWASSIKLDFQFEGGFTANSDPSRRNRNFGQLTNDLSYHPILNQAALTVSRGVDPKATSVDVGFKIALMYGSDSRIYHTMGVFDQLIHDRNQLDVTEASVSARIPQLFANGLDLKAGIWPTPMGAETIDPKPNMFYSHSYIYNYGLPFKHTGVLGTAHVSDVLDLYLGVDTGVNTFLAYGWGDNNNRPGGNAGFGLNLLGGKLTVLALTHIGPEDSKHLVPFANDALRYLNDVVVTFKPNEKWTYTLEANYIRDDGYHAEGYGAAGYIGYALNDQVTLNGRAEIWRDNNNFYVFTPSGNLDFVNAQRGVFANLITASKPTTYSEFTAGASFKLQGLPQQISTAMIRPEVRYDRALNNSTPFGDGTGRSAWTVAADLILGF